MAENQLAPKSAVNVELAQTGFMPKNLEEAWQFSVNLSKSDLVPSDMYHEKPANCMIALDLAARWAVPWLAVMQHVYVVHGRPALDSTLTTALVNRSGVFQGPISYQVEGDDPRAEDYKVRAYATRKGDVNPLFGPWIDWKLVHGEKWDQPKGKMASKWMTMPDQMFHYRAATWFQRRYCPELTFGMTSVEEAQDIGAKTIESHDVTEVSRVPGTEGLKDRLGMNGDKKPEDTTAENTPAPTEEKKAPSRVFACTHPNCKKEYKLDPITSPETACECGKGTLIFKTEKAKRLKEAKEKDAEDTAAAKRQAEADELKKEKDAEDTAKEKFGTEDEAIMKFECGKCKAVFRKTKVQLDEDPFTTNTDGELQCRSCLTFNLKLV